MSDYDERAHSMHYESKCRFAATSRAWVVQANQGRNGCARGVELTSSAACRIVRIVVQQWLLLLSALHARRCTIS